MLDDLEQLSRNYITISEKLFSSERHAYWSGVIGNPFFTGYNLEYATGLLDGYHYKAFIEYNGDNTNGDIVDVIQYCLSDLHEKKKECEHDKFLWYLVKQHHNTNDCLNIVYQLFEKMEITINYSAEEFIYAKFLLRNIKSL